MQVLTLIGITIFILLLSVMSYTSGTKVSLSALTIKWRWLLLVTLWSQILILPLMLSITPELYKWIPFIGMGGIILCGGANVLDKNDELIHMIAAVITFICFTVWIIIMNKCCLLPIILCLAAGKENLKWRIEVGLIIGVYLILLLNIFNI